MVRAFRGLFVTAILVALLAATLAPAAVAVSDSRPVIVDLGAPATAEQVAQLRAAGLNVGVVYKPLPAVSGNLPQGRAAAVAGLPFVEGIRADSVRSPDARRGAAGSPP